MEENMRRFIIGLGVIFSVAVLLVSCATAQTAAEDKTMVEESAEQVSYPITDGVFCCKVSETRQILLKFYEDGTFYLEGIMGGAWRGTYKVRDKHISYYDCAEDGTPISADIDRSEYIKLSEKAVFFYEEDGMTKFMIYAADDKWPNYSKHKVDGVEPNAIAYADNALYNVYAEGTRRLTQDPEKVFTIEDEKDITRYHFMLSSSDNAITVTQKGYTSNLFGGEVSGKYTEQDGVLVLLDAEGKEYGKLSVADDGTAAIEKAGRQIKLAKYEKTVVEDKILKTLKTVGEDGFVMDLSLNFNKDNTFDIIGVVSGIERLRISGKWALGTQDNPVVFSDLTNGKMTTKVDNGTMTFSWAGYISATITGNTVFTMPTSEILELRGAGSQKAQAAPAPQEVTTVDTYNASLMGGKMVFDLTLYSDGTAVFSGNGRELLKGTWEGENGVPASMNFANAAIEIVAGENGTVIKYNGPMGMGDRTVQLDLTK